MTTHAISTYVLDDELLISTVAALVSSQCVLLRMRFVLLQLSGRKTHLNNKCFSVADGGSGSRNAARMAEQRTGRRARHAADCTRTALHAAADV